MRKQSARRQDLFLFAMPSGGRPGGINAWKQTRKSHCEGQLGLGKPVHTVENFSSLQPRHNFHILGQT
jgi:hypothetical protein